MELRLARLTDLPQLKEIYTAIYNDMLAAGVDLWNEHYPYDEFPGDISANRLWVLCSENDIAAAFALDKCPDMPDLTWQDNDAPADIIMRLGVNVRYQKCGLGRKCIEHAGDISLRRGAEYLRLLVADCNVPAEKFYQHCGFTCAKGIHTEHEAGIPYELHGYGYEIKLQKGVRS